MAEEHWSKRKQNWPQNKYSLHLDLEGIFLCLSSRCRTFARNPSWRHPPSKHVRISAITSIRIAPTVHSCCHLSALISMLGELKVSVIATFRCFACCNCNNHEYTTHRCICVIVHFFYVPWCVVSTCLPFVFIPARLYFLLPNNAPFCFVCFLCFSVTSQQPSAEPSASKPILQGLMFNQTVYVGQDMIFRCRVFNDANLHIQWIFKTTNKTYGNDTSDYKVLKLTTSALRRFLVFTSRLDDHGQAGHSRILACFILGHNANSECWGNGWCRDTRSSTEKNARNLRSLLVSARFAPTVDDITAVATERVFTLYL